jgi:DNA-binding NtrC family response regulator
MTHEIVLVSEDPEAHGDLMRSIERTGVRVLPRRNLDEALQLLDASEPSVVAIVFDYCSPAQYNLGLLTELSLRLPKLRQLVFHPRENQDGERFELQSGIHFFRKPLADPNSYQVISDTLRETLAGKTTEEIGPIEPISTAASVFDGAALPAGNRAKNANASGKGSHLFSEAFLRRVASADVPVLLHGETGVGKEVMAKRLWAYSGRANKPFLKLNCAALPSELIESELFGYEKGAFTGATIDKIGKFEMAQNGTILLDEIGDMDVRLQAKLLQVLQDGEVQPLGSSRIVNVNVRVMAATHRDLRRAIEQGSFREDLYYRLSVINITIPPLRERPGEVLPLAEKLLQRHLPEGFPTPVITEALERAMLNYHWPGNVRELENVMRRFLVYQDAHLLAQELIADGIAVKPERAAASLTGLAQPASSIDFLAQASREAESKLLLEALEAVRWNRRQAALRLNIDYKAFLYKLQKHGIVESKAKLRDRDVSA